VRAQSPGCARTVTFLTCLDLGPIDPTITICGSPREAALGRTQEAIDQYRQAVQIKPDLADAHLRWSEALEALGRFEEAVEHYQQALTG